MASEHHKRGTTNPSNKAKHENGQARKQRDKNGEKGDVRHKPNPNKRRTNKIEEKIVEGTILIGTSAIIIYLVANDVTVVGTADDAMLVAIVPIWWDCLAAISE